MDDILRAIEKEHLKERGEFNPGDVVRIHERITEGGCQGARAGF